MTATDGRALHQRVLQVDAGAAGAGIVGAVEIGIRDLERLDVFHPHTVRRPLDVSANNDDRFLYVDALPAR